MDSDVCPADQPASAPSDTQFSDTVLVDGASEIEVSRQTVAASLGSQVEDLDSYSLIEPPPLDWRSDSSSEAGSADDMGDPGFSPSVDPLDKASPEPVLLPLDMSDTETQLNINQQELVMKNAKLIQQVEVEEGERVENLKGVSEKLTFNVMDVENIVAEEEVANRRSGDEDHSRIQTLLSQLQLMGDEPRPSHHTPPHHHYSSLSEVEACALSLMADDSTETTGLLFSENHQRDLLGLLQCTEIGATPHPTCLPHRGEVDAVVSVSYSQEDAQRFWGHHENGQRCRHRDDSLTSLPDDEYPEPVWMKLGENPPDEEGAAQSEQVS